MLQSANGGHMAATDVADYLVGKNVPFRDAHEISGSLVRYCLENNKTLNELKLEEYKKFSKLFEKDVYKKIDLKTLVENRKVPGGPSKAAVKKEIADLLAKLKSVK
jgi:argininosuccinate lyase